MLVGGREAREHSFIELDAHVGVDGVEAIAVEDRLAVEQPPATLALLPAVEMACLRGDLAERPVDRRALRDHHL